MTAFDGAVAVVTGGASGIGRCFALDLAQRGGQVVVADIDEPGAQRTAEEVERAGGQALAVRCDVRHATDLEALAEAAESWAGPVDLAILNAGVLATGPLIATTAADVERLFSINVLGVAQGCRIFGAKMSARGRGALLNVASVAGFLPLPHMAMYAASKAAVVSLSAALYGELRPAGVSVTVLCPSFTRTEIVANATTADDRVQRLGQRLFDALAVDPRKVAAAGLDAAARGRLYAVDTMHARVGWAFARTAPRVLARLGALASHRFGPPDAH